jgi:hypothetical protein
LLHHVFSDMQLQSGMVLSHTPACMMQLGSQTYALSVCSAEDFRSLCVLDVVVQEMMMAQVYQLNVKVGVASATRHWRPPSPL